jgi:hypothetical protein
MRTNHTPGPWGIKFVFPEPNFVESEKFGNFYAHDATIVCGDKIIGSAGYMTTTNFGWPRVDNYDEFLANANLMAAAPELLQTLKDLLDLIKVNDDPMLLSAIECAAEVIAKAEGGEHE